MYIWTAILFEKELEERIRNQAKNIGFKNELDFVAFDLPQHISLKLPFQCGDDIFCNVVKYLEGYLQRFKPFSVEIEGVELVKGTDNIIWLSIKENEILRKAHDKINNDLLEKYNIELGEYHGENFKFHSTLFMDDKGINAENYEIAFAELKALSLGQPQIIKRACIGISESGKMGEYRIHKTICLKNKKNGD